MSDLELYRARLPALPIPLPSLIGGNVVEARLIRNNGSRDPVEAVMARFRAEQAAERLPFRRVYYLAPVRVAGRPTGRYKIMYAWDLEKPRTDMFVGTIEGDDVAAAQILIGNQMSRARMGWCRWELYEDRGCDNPIEMGRFDAWDLLKGVGEADIRRLADKGLVPDIHGWWRMDGNIWDTTCPRCGKDVWFNAYVFNVDSAICATCGIRPVYSRHIGRYLKDTLDRTMATNADETLMRTIAYMGYLGAHTNEIETKDLPDGHTAHSAIQLLASRSRSLGVERAMRDELVVAEGAARVLREKLATGGPFTEVEQRMADLLLAIDRRR